MLGISWFMPLRPALLSPAVVPGLWRGDEKRQAMGRRAQAVKRRSVVAGLCAADFVIRQGWFTDPLFDFVCEGVG